MLKHSDSLEEEVDETAESTPPRTPFPGVVLCLDTEGRFQNVYGQ